jgi:hypothetical protein
MDAYGCVVNSEMISNGGTDPNISMLSKGVYFVTLNEGQQVIKVIKE